MFNFNRTLIYLKGLTLSPNPNPLLHHYPSLFSLHFCTNTSDSTSFAASYLIHNFGFSPQFASKLCSTHRLRFKTTQNPDSVLNFFTNHGFSDSQLCNMISKVPGLLCCNPSKRVLPKFQFLLSKGASNSDIVNLVSKNPRVLSCSLENHIVPTYQLLYRFLQSDKDIIASAIQNPDLLCYHIVPRNITMLIENGVSDSNIARLLRLRLRSPTLMARDTMKFVEEVKNLGFNPLLHHYPSLFSLHFCTNTSDSTSFAASYLIHNFGFSPQFASKLCSTHRLRFKTTQKPDSVLNFFTNHGFSDSQLCNMISKVPGLLCCNPSKRVLPKFQFLLSKGASNSDIVNLVSKNPRVLSCSLENHIVPTYQLLYRFLQSDKDIIASAIQNPDLLCYHIVPRNITMLIENGVSDSNIARLLRLRCRTLRAHDTMKFVEEVKNLGFNPSKIIFSVALIAKSSVRKNLWEEKVEAFKKWGWSDEDAFEAFRKKPYCMLTSVVKINLVMSFWVNQLGWDAIAIAKTPYILSLSLEKRIIPRVAVVQFLLSKGLTNKNASLTYPFVVSEKMFLDMFIKRFKNESSYLLKLYKEKLNHTYTRDKTCML